MIASVVATLEVDDISPQRITEKIAGLPNVEVGEFVPDSRRLPIAIDSPAPATLEETTRSLQEIPGVAFVDVVYVHFEDDEENEGELAGSRSTNTNRSGTP